MILMLHIVFGVATLLAGLAALAMRKKEFIKYQVTGFVGTILSGAVLLIIEPNVLTHLCVSGAMFTIVALALYFRAQEAIAKA